MKNYNQKRSCKITKVNTQGNQCLVSNRINLDAGRMMLNKRVNTQNQCETSKGARRYIVKKNLNNIKNQRFTFVKENMNSLKYNQLRPSYNQYGYKSQMNISQKLKRYRIRHDENKNLEASKREQNINRKSSEKNTIADIRSYCYTKNEEQIKPADSLNPTHKQSMTADIWKQNNNKIVAKRIKQEVLTQPHKLKLQRSSKPMAQNNKYNFKQSSFHKRNDQEKEGYLSIIKNRKKLTEKDFKIDKLIGAGTFGKVYSAIFKQNSVKVAIKKVFNDTNYKNREIELMRIVNSPFVIKQLADFTTEETDKSSQNDLQIKQFYHFVMPSYKCNLFELLQEKMRERSLSNLETKVLLYQMFRGLLYLHSRGICHRDLKPQNILVNQNNNLVICDLGSAKILTKGEPNISYICSRCYRAPQLIFGNTEYTINIDIWSAGCIILEILNSRPLFIGKDSLQHLIEIIKVMGTPSKEEILMMNPDYDIKNFSVPKVPKKQWNQIFPKIDTGLMGLLNSIMVYSPSQRLNAGQVLSHSYFNELREQSVFKELSQLSDTSNFFVFDHYEIKFMKNQDKLIPKWYKNRTIN